MSAPQRARACDHCHAIKIKCKLGSTGGPGPCERCVRLGKECVVTPPKRQKDRVAELEAQVEALTKLLESQQIQAPVDTSTSTTEKTFGGSRHGSVDNSQQLQPKKRKLRDALLLETDHGQVSAKDFMLDNVVSQDVQHQMLDRYLKKFVPAFPLVPLTGSYNYSELREHRPILLQAIVYAASPGMLTIEVQEGLVKSMMNIFTSLAIAGGKKSIELVQAIQLVVLFYRPPRDHAHISAFQLARLGTDIAEDIGIGIPYTSSSLGFPNGEAINTVDARRTWHVCQVLSTAMAIFIRRPNARPWNHHDESTLYLLEYSQDALESDRLLCQYVRAERLCERIASQSNFYDLTKANDLSEPKLQLTMHALQNLITDWKAQTPPGLHCLGLTIWEYMAILYLHESVLHTSTNKQSFAAPFIAERLSVTDFPAPIVTQEHITSMYALRTTAQALLDLSTSLDLSTLISLPAVLVWSRVAYAMYLLVKLYIATTAIGNTYGVFLDPESLKVEQNLEYMVQVAHMVFEFDERCSPARLLSSVPRMKEWFQNYKDASVLHEPKPNDSEAPIMNDAIADVPQSTGDFPMDWDLLASDTDAVNLGLGDMFADPLLADWFTEPLLPIGTDNFNDEANT